MNLTRPSVLHRSSSVSALFIFISIPVGCSGSCDGGNHSPSSGCDPATHGDHSPAPRRTKVSQSVRRSVVSSVGCQVGRSYKGARSY